MGKRILIIEDHDDFRKIVRSHLETQDIDIEIFEADTGEVGIARAVREKPDVVLMDIRLPNINGIDAAERIKKQLPQCSIIALTMFETDSFRKVFKSDDIAAYIGKSELFDSLIPVLKKHIQ